MNAWDLELDGWYWARDGGDWDVVDFTPAHSMNLIWDACAPRAGRAQVLQPSGQLTQLYGYPREVFTFGVEDPHLRATQDWREIRESWEKLCRQEFIGPLVPGVMPQPWRLVER